MWKFRFTVFQNHDWSIGKTRQLIKVMIVYDLLSLEVKGMIQKKDLLLKGKVDKVTPEPSRLGFSKQNHSQLSDLEILLIVFENYKISTNLMVPPE